MNDSPFITEDSLAGMIIECAMISSVYLVSIVTLVTFTLALFT